MEWEGGRRKGKQINNRGGPTIPFHSILWLGKERGFPQPNNVGAAPPWIPTNCHSMFQVALLCLAFTICASMPILIRQYCWGRQSSVPMMYLNTHFIWKSNNNISWALEWTRGLHSQWPHHEHVRDIMECFNWREIWGCSLYLFEGSRRPQSVVRRGPRGSSLLIHIQSSKCQKWPCLQLPFWSHTSFQSYHTWVYKSWVIGRFVLIWMTWTQMHTTCI